MNLHEVFPAGSTVLTHVNRVSRSGMTRWIECYTSEGLNVTEAVAEVLGYLFDPRKGMKVTGCGMDMGFAVVYALSRKLYQGEGVDAGYVLKQEWMY